MTKASPLQSWKFLVKFMFWKLYRMFRIHQLHCNFHSDFVCEHLDNNPKSWKVETIFLDDLSKSVDVGADCVSRANDVQGTTSPGWKRYLHFTPIIYTKYDLSTVLVGINKKRWKNSFALKQRTSKALKFGFVFNNKKIPMPQMLFLQKLCRGPKLHWIIV